MPPAKFMFESDFGPVKEAPPKITPEQLAAAVSAAEIRGYQRGVAAAEAQARTDAERRTAAAFERIASAIAVVASGLQAVESRLETEAVEVAVAVGSKLASALIAREPLGEISALASESFNALQSAPHVVVRVNTALHAAARERLDDISRRCGFEGRLVILGGTDIAPGDCRIEWADGGAIRDRNAVAAAIDDLVRRYVAARQHP